MSPYISGQDMYGVYLDSLYNEFLTLRSIRANIQIQEEVSASYQKCGFGIYSQIKFHFNDFSKDQQRFLEKYLLPPETEKTLVSPSGRFLIHYNESYNKPSYDSTLSALQNAQLVAQIADSVYNFEIEYLHYPPPPKCNSDKGEKYNIFIINCSPYYGITTPEYFFNGNLASSYIQIHNNYNNFATKGLNAARVTLAHEFFHAIQLGNYKCYNFFDRSEWFLFESSSTAMEEFMYDDINDYYHYLALSYVDSYFRNPTRHLSDYQGYGISIFPIYLKEKHGQRILKSIWENYKNMSAIEALSSGISEVGSSLASEFTTFGSWAYLTGYRKYYADTLSDSFEEGDKYPLVRYTRLDFPLTSFPVKLEVPSISNAYYRILVNNGVYDDTIDCIITDTNISGALKNSYDNFTLGVYNYPEKGARLITNNCYIGMDFRNNDWFSEAIFLNGRSKYNPEHIISDIDYAYPNPFYYEKHKRILLPADSNVSHEARVYIYTSGMELIAERICPIVYPHNKFVVEWDGLNENGQELKTGVYIFMVKSSSTNKMGKIAIFN